MFDRLRAAGYDPEFQEFTYDFVGSRTPAVLSVVGGPSFAPGFQFSVPNSLTPPRLGGRDGGAVAVDLRIPSTGGSTSGCEAADFAGFPAGAIALVQRGTCDFVVKVAERDRRGASAVVIMNEGNDADPHWALSTRPRPVTSRCSPRRSPRASNSPTAGSPASPAARSASAPTSSRRPFTTRNVIAETDRGDDDNVVVVGAHLDSVEDGPGINDNGSGSATILEIAEQMAKVKPRNTVRFIWFSAEESGLLGSAYYVEQLSDAEVGDIAAMLNFDMLASPNFVRFVYDGDLSDTPAPPSGAPEGSGAIEEIFNDFFDAQGLPYEPTEFSGRSDYRAFIQNGVPAGGLFTGAEVVKTAAQQAIYGGAAGEQFDPCYHAFCDTMSTLLGSPPAIALRNPANAAALAATGSSAWTR